MAGQVSEAFQLSGVARTFGAREALRGVGLRVMAGERLAIIGPSGAGKSTLLSLLNTSQRPTAGSVTILGQDPTALSPQGLRALRSRIGTVYQQYLLIPQCTVLQNVVAGRLGRLSLWRAVAALVRPADVERVAEVLAQVGLEERIYDRVDGLSGGEQQRLAIARVLYQDPEVILADEPLSSLDPARGADVLALLMRAGGGRTLVVSTHQLAPVLPHFPRVVGLQEGRVVFDKAPDALTDLDLAQLYGQQGNAPLAIAARALRAAGKPQRSTGTG